MIIFLPLRGQVQFNVCMLSPISCVQLFVTPWTVAHQISLSMEFSRQEYWNGLLFPTSGDLPDPGIKPEFPVAPELAGRVSVPHGKPLPPRRQKTIR